MKEIPELKHGLDLPKHMAEHIYMFSGESVRVKFKAGQALIGDVLDWFGLDVKLKEGEAGTVIVDVRVNEQAMFYWSLQYGTHIEVLEPEGLRARLGKAAAEIAEKYG